MTSKPSRPERKTSPWNSLLFLHGYVADPQLARRLAGEEAARKTPAATEAAPLTHGEAMRQLLARGRRLSLRLCQGIGSGLVHLQ